MDNGITPMLTVDGVSIKWADYNTFDFETTVLANGTPTITAGVVVIGVVDASGFAENDRITLISGTNVAGTEDIMDGIIQTVNVNTNTITVQLQSVNGSETGFPGTLAIKAGEKIRRLYWARNDCDDITRGSHVPTHHEAQSYIQHFSRQITFNKQETNVLYKWEGEVPNALAWKFNQNVGILFQELAKAIYKGKNMAPGVGAYAKMEMLGLEKIVSTVGGARNYATLAAGTSHLSELFSDIESVFTAGGAADGQVIMLVNDRMNAELSRVDRDHIRFEKTVDSITLKHINTIETPYGSVEILRDPIMNILYPNAMAFIFPKKNIGLWIRENDAYSPIDGVTKSDESIRVAERFTNLHECKAFDIYFEMGMYAYGVTCNDVSQAPFKSVSNFKAIGFPANV